MAEVRGFNPQAEDTGREGGFIKEVTFLSRGKKAIKKREVPIGATVSGEINEPALKEVPRETVEEPSVVVADHSEAGPEKELSSVPMSVTVSKERMDAFHSMDLMALKKEMVRIGRQYGELNDVKNNLEGIINSYQERIDNNLKLQADYNKSEDDARKKGLNESVEEIQARRKELQEKLEQIQKKQTIKKKELLDWRNSNGGRFMLLEAEWNMLGDLIKAKENIEEAA